MGKAKVVYDNIAAGSVEKFNVSTENSAYFSNLQKIKNPHYSSIEYSNPCDYYSTILDGSNLPIDENASVSFWSESISNENGYFEDPIILEFASAEKFESDGIKFVFDETNEIYPTQIKICYYSEDEMIVEKYSQPTSAVFYIETNAKLYDRIIIEFYSLNMPFAHLKIKSIIQGDKIIFYGKDLINISIFQEMNLISSELPISTCDLEIKTNEQYFFQKGQKINVYFDEKLQGAFYVKKIIEKENGKFSFQAEDAIGKMESANFVGGMYRNENAVNIINEISKSCGVLFDISSEIYDKKINGYIPYTNCRRALCLVLMAIGCVAKTSKSEQLKVYTLKNDVIQQLETDRVLIGEKKEFNEPFYSLNINCHRYYGDNSKKTTLFKSEENGIGKNIFIIFNEPVFDVEITNGEIVEIHDNYAIINAYEDCNFIGYGYAHEVNPKEMINSNFLNYFDKSIISIPDSTLITSKNIDFVLEMCYNYFIRTNKISCKITERDKTKRILNKYGNSIFGVDKYLYNSQTVHEKDIDLGETIIIPTKKESVNATITKLKYNLNGNIIIKDVEAIIQ